MSTNRISKDELIDTLEKISLVKIQYQDEDFWHVNPVFSSNNGLINVLVDNEDLKHNIHIGNKLTCKFLHNEYEYVIEGTVHDICDNAPLTLSIQTLDAKKYFNNRKYVRYSSNYESKLILEDSQAFGTIRDISLGGVKLVTHEILEVGSRVHMDIQIDENSILSTTSKVLRKISESQNIFCYGIEFLNLSNDHKSQLNNLIRNYELNSARILTKSNMLNLIDTKICIANLDGETSFLNDLKSHLNSVGAYKIDIYPNFNFYPDYFETEKPKVLIINALEFNDHTKDIIKNVSLSHPNTRIILILPFELAYVQCSIMSYNVNILFKPFISTEFEDEIIKYL